MSCDHKAKRRGAQPAGAVGLFHAVNVHNKSMYFKTSQKHVVLGFTYFSSVASYCSGVANCLDLGGDNDGTFKKTPRMSM